MAGSAINLTPIAVFILSIILSNGLFAQPANDNCTNAVNLSVQNYPGGACTNGSTNNGTLQGGENTACFTSGGGCTVDKSTWYSFNSGTNDSLWLDLEQTNSSNCVSGYATYGPFTSATGGCLPTAVQSIDCQNTLTATRGVILEPLVPNRWYMVQIISRNGGGGGDRFMDYCIGIEDLTDCKTCSNPCGAACGFSSPPTVAQVTSTCPTGNIAPHLASGASSTYCASLTAVNSSIDFSIIINGLGCLGGNITALSWAVYNASGCGFVTSGVFPNLTANGLTPGNNYVWCYTLTAACTHLAHYPYFVGAAPLGIDLISFEGKANGKMNEIEWVYEGDKSDLLSLERSENGIDFQSLEEFGNEVAKVKPLSNSNEPAFMRLAMEGFYKDGDIRSFSHVDANFPPGLNYYRLSMKDGNGEMQYSGVIEILNDGTSEFQIGEVYPSPAESEALIEIIAPVSETVTLEFMTLNGRVERQLSIQAEAGRNLVSLPVEDLASGLYFIKIHTNNVFVTRRFVVL